MRIIFCPHRKGVSKFLQKPRPDILEEIRKDECPDYIPKNPGGNLRVCKKKVEETNSN
ncbi:MAG: hypothetical protein QMD77_01995 [Patescibacteria group bacterium]|nr:hypothetical protein [Patescibacteria group bacterium]